MATKNELTSVNEEGIKKLDGAALAVLGKSNIQGFQKAFLMADAIANLSDLLTPAYMAPIMKLQGTALGFKTDKDKNGGYPEQDVKRCLIEAVLKGLQPIGNQFNIIAGNCYPTKEGCGELLKKIPGLSYKITPKLPRVNADKTGAAIILTIEHSMNNGPEQKNEPEFPLKIDSYTSVDAMIGKGTRKARMWLYNFLTGSDLVDGDVQDISHTVMSTTTKDTPEQAERKRVLLLIEDCKTVGDWMKLRDTLPAGFEVEIEEKTASFLE